MEVPLSFLFPVVLVIGSIALTVIPKLASHLRSSFNSPLRALRGPPNASYIFGNFKQTSEGDQTLVHEGWVGKYGPTFKFAGWFAKPRLFTMDLRALNHVLTHSVDYQKPHQARIFLSQLLGEGVLLTEGEQHRQQRRIMNPAFGPAQIRDLTEIFIDKSIQLRDIWMSEASKQGAPTRINVQEGLSKMTLDVIGLAGFNYAFDALNPEGKPNELNEAFSTIFRSSTAPSILQVLQAAIPALSFIPTQRSRRVGHAREVMRRLGMQLIKEKRDALANTKSGASKDESHGRDLLTLLIKANMAMDVPEDQRLSDEDVLAQVPTFLVAGHETTSTAITWCLYALTQAPNVQVKLHEELTAVATDTPSMDELNALQYLDAVVRETLRVHAPVPISIRTAMHDDAIPLNEPLTDVHGQTHDTVQIGEGDSVVIPILAINRSKELWGDDVLEFRPERWASQPEAVSAIPGVWGHMLSFLGGPRSCIGYRFSLVEMKALLFTLVRAFEFKLAVPPSDIASKMGVVQRPIVLTEPKGKRNQMPLLVSLR